MFTVAEINDPKKLASFSLVWQTLWDRTPNRSFFQTRDWLENYWRHFGAHRKLRVLMVMSALRPIGIVPLVIKRTTTAVGSLRVLTYPLDGWGPFFGPIGSDPTATMFGALKHLAATPRDWDLLDLRGIDDAGLDKGRTANAFRLAGLPATSRVWEENREVAIAEWSTGEQFQLRRRVKDAERALWQHGGWEFVRARVTEGAPELSPICRAMFQESRALLTPVNMPFGWLPDVFEAAVCTATADVCQLWVNGRLTVAAFNTVAGEAVHPVAIGSEANATSAAQTVFLGRMLFDGLDRGDSTYLFGPKTATWAADWLPASRPSQRLTHFAGFRPRAQLLRLNALCKRLWTGTPQAVRA